METKNKGCDLPQETMMAKKFTNEQESEIHSILSEIDNFKSNLQMRNLCILATSIVQYGRVYGTEYVINVYKMLKEEYSDKKALAILMKMMEFAGFSSERLVRLSSLLSAGTKSDESVDVSLTSDFSYQRLLVLVSNNLVDEGHLKKVVDALTDEERGIAADQVTTSHALLYYMTNAGTIKHGNCSSLNVLVEKLNAVGLRALANKVYIKIQAISSGEGFDCDTSSKEVEFHAKVPPTETVSVGGAPDLEEFVDGGDKFEGVDYTAMGENGETAGDDVVPLDDDHSIQGSKSSLESGDQKTAEGDPLIFGPEQQLKIENTKQDKKCKTKTKLCCCFIICKLLTILVLLGALTSTLWFSFSLKGQSASMSIYRNITYLAFDEGIDTRFHDKVSFVAQSKASEGHDLFKVNVCQVDCTLNEPQTFVRQLHDNNTLEGTDMRRFLARFSSRNRNLYAQLVSEYMLSGSNISITVNYSDPDAINAPTISFLLFDNVDNCSDFFDASGPADKALRNFTFKSSDEVSFTVPSDSYYCAVWDILPALNFSFEYKITSHILSYNITYYLEREPSLCSQYGPSDSPFDITLQRNVLYNKKVCLLVYQSFDYSYNVLVNGDIIAAKTDNPGFIFSTIFLGLLLCFVLLVILVFVLCLCFAG